MTDNWRQIVWPQSWGEGPPLPPFRCGSAAESRARSRRIRRTALTTGGGTEKHVRQFKNQPTYWKQNNLSRQWRGEGETGDVDAGGTRTNKDEEERGRRKQTRHSGTNKIDLYVTCSFNPWLCHSRCTCQRKWLQLIYIVSFFTVNDWACSARTLIWPRSALLASPSLRTVRGRGHSEVGRALPAYIPVHISNHSLSFLRLRWVNAEGRAPLSHALTLAPNKEWDRRRPEWAI